jgi:hypothetical protein
MRIFPVLMSSFDMDPKNMIELIQVKNKLNYCEFKNF